MMKRLVAAAAVVALGACGAGCAAETTAADTEQVGADEAAIAYTDASTVQLYNSNTKHMSEPGKASFEGTDFTQLLSYMKAQTSLPDIITLQEIGTRSATWVSQPCQVYVDALNRIVKPTGAKTAWHCIVADGSPSTISNASGGAAIIHRGRFVPSGAKRSIGLWYWTPSGCIRQSAGTGWTALVQKFDDGAHTIAVASVHLPTVGEGASSTGDDCSGKNIALVEDALAATKADVTIVAGDMNHGDATRHLDKAGVVVHDWWETTYAKSNAFLNQSTSSRTGYRDAWFRDCAAGFSPSPTTAYPRDQMQAISTCLASKHWSINGATTLDPRIDWVLVEGASSLSDARTISYTDAYRAYLTATGKTSAPATHYSDHRAQMLRVKY